MTAENAAEQIRGRIREFRKRVLINFTVSGFSLVTTSIEMNMLPPTIQGFSPELMVIGANTTLTVIGLGATFWRLIQAKGYENQLFTK